MVEEPAGTMRLEQARTTAWSAARTSSRRSFIAPEAGRSKDEEEWVMRIPKRQTLSYYTIRRQGKTRRRGTGVGGKGREG
jgi:hypothetical protein